MISHILFTIVSSVFGIMLFFSFVVAPIGFKSLSEKNFRKFIRTIFPYYYSVNLILLTLVAITIFIYYGFVFDSTVNDFVSGELERAVVSCYKEKAPDIIVIEGQA